MWSDSGNILEINSIDSVENEIIISSYVGPEQLHRR